MVANFTQTNDEMTIDLAGLARYLWEHKKKVIISSLAGALLMAATSLFMRNIYETKVLLAPAQESTGALAHIAGQFGGLASLTGIDIGGNDQLIVEGIATFTARDFLLRFVHDLNLKPKLFYDDWDKNKKKWKEPNFLEVITKNVRDWLVKDDEPPRYADPNEPTDWNTYERLTDDFIHVSQDKKTSLVTLNVRAYHPQDAVDWAQELVHRVNEHLRKSKKDEAEKSIAYLEKALRETSFVEMQAAIYQLIEAQTKTVMLANVSEEFTFKTVDPAFYPEKKAKPRRGLMMIAGGFFGAFIAITYLIICYLPQAVTKNEQRSSTSDSSS